MTLTRTRIKRIPKRSYTYEDYKKLPEDGKRYEILNGELNMTPAPVTLHQRISRKLLIELSIFIDKNNLGEVFSAPYDVLLDDLNILQPDIIFISSENKDIITDKNLRGAPDLVIEILSPSTAYNDLVDKKEIYEKFGVKEYWIIDPQKNWVEVYSMKGNKYSLFNRIEKKGKIKSSILNKLEIDLAKIF